MAKDVFVHTRTASYPSGAALGSVFVSLHDSTGTFLTSATTDSDGNAFLGNRAAATYEIRITAPSPSKVQAGPVQSITVVDTADPNVFDVLVDTSTISSPTDDQLCRCAGVFLDSFGTPLDNLVMMFSEGAVRDLSYAAASSTTYAVIPTSKVVKTDANGYASVDLYRTGTYAVHMEGYENIARTFLVPDSTTSSLPDVIFPVISHIEYTYNNAVVTPTTAPVLVPSLTVGDSAELTVETIYRSGLRVDGLQEITLTSSDTDSLVISMSLTDNKVVVEAISAGTASLEVASVDPSEGQGISILPSPALYGDLSITVVA